MTYSSEYLRAAPRLVSIKPDACLFSEAYFLLYLSKSKNQSTEVKPKVATITYRTRSKVNATVITKIGVDRVGYPTSLVLKCDQNPILEAMITNQTPDLKVIRPFCGAADYSKRPTRPPIVGIDNELAEMRRTFNIKDNSAVGMLASLLEIVGLTSKIGKHFFDNIFMYTNYVNENNLHLGHWSESEPINAISTGAYPEL